jgi:hypothetical protein
MHSELYHKNVPEYIICISSIQMRHTSFFDDIVYRGHFIERLMNSLCKIKKHVISEMLIIEGFIMDNIQVIIDELLLKSSCYNAQ